MIQKNMGKNTIRLTENELKNIIKESVTRILIESDFSPYNGHFSQQPMKLTHVNDLDNETRMQVFNKVKSVYDSNEGTVIDKYEKLMREFGLNGRELIETGIRDIWDALDAEKEKFEAFNDGWY